MMLDIIEHLKEPEKFMDELRFAAVCKRPEVVITTANIGFLVTRLMLFLGQSTMAERAFSMRPTRGSSPSARWALLLEQSGYKILEVRGISGAVSESDREKMSFSRFLCASIRL